MDPHPANLSHLSVHRLPAQSTSIGHTPFVYDKGTATIHLGPGYQAHAQIREHPQVAPYLKGPIYSGYVQDGTTGWVTMPGTNDAASIAATLSKEMGQPVSSETRLASLRCPTCGDPIESPDCPRCDWGHWNVIEDSLSNPIDPTTGLKSDFRAQSKVAAELPPHINPDDITPAYGRERNVYYHVAPAAARESIKQQGLMGHTSEGIVESPWAGAEWRERGGIDQPHGNYLFDSLPQAYSYTQGLMSQQKAPRLDPADWFDHDMTVPQGDEYNDGDAWIRHDSPEGSEDWDDERWEQYYDNEEDMSPFDHETHLDQLPEHLRGYDIWQVRTDPTKHRILQDPENALVDGEELTPQEAMKQVRQERDPQWGYEGDKDPSRWYTPDHIAPEHLEHQEHVPLWSIPEYPDANGWPGAEAQDVPHPLTKVPIQRHHGVWRTLPESRWDWYG